MNTVLSVISHSSVFCRLVCVFRRDRCVFFHSMMINDICLEIRSTVKKSKVARDSCIMSMNSFLAAITPPTQVTLCCIVVDVVVRDNIQLAEFAKNVAHKV